MNIVKLSDFIGTYVKNNEKLQKAILEENWKKIMKELSEKIKIKRIKKGKIILSVEDSVAKHYIISSKEKILQDINSEIDFIIEDIQVDVK